MYVEHPMDTPCIRVPAIHSAGYGLVSKRGVKMYSHRVAWEGAHGPIPVP